MHDFTKGSITRSMIAYMIPMIFASIFQQLYYTVDGIIVGQFIGTEAQAAIGASFPVTFMLNAVITGLSMGASITIAQFTGGQDKQSVRKTIDTVFKNIVYLSIAVPFMGLIMSKHLLIVLQVPKTILPLATSYMQIIFISSFFIFSFNALNSILRGLGDSKTPTKYLILSTIINIVLDLAFVVVFKWGIIGVGLATVIAQGIAFLACVFYLNENHAMFRVHFRGLVSDKKILNKVLKIGLPSGIQQVSFALGIMLVQIIVNSYGDIAMAAYFATSRIDTFALMPVFSLGSAVTTCVGQNYGASNRSRMKAGLYNGFLIAVVLSILTSTFILMLDEQILSLFNSDPRVVEVGLSYIYYVIPFYILYNARYALTGILKGTGDTFTPMVLGSVALWLVRLPLSYILSKTMGIKGIWMAVPISWGVNLGTTYIIYLYKERKQLISNESFDQI